MTSYKKHPPIFVDPKTGTEFGFFLTDDGKEYVFWTNSLEGGERVAVTVEKERFDRVWESV